MGGLALGFCGCHGAKPDPEANRIKAQIKAMEAESAAIDDKIKNAKDDNGLKTQLDQDRELLHSRMERLKERLKGRPTAD